MLQILASRRGLRSGLSLPLLVLAVFILAACQTGDFGRRQVPAFHDEITGFLGRQLAYQRGEPVSSFRFTDHEKRMRAVAYRFGMPPRLRHDAERIIWDLQYKRIFPAYFPPIDANAYYVALKNEKPHSHETYFRMIALDALADIELLYDFIGVAQQVHDGDTLRLRAAMKLAPGAVVPDSPALARIEENRLVVDTVRYKLRERHAAYAHAFSRFAVETPSVVANETEAALERYERAIVRFEADLARAMPGFWQQGKHLDIVSK